MSNTDFDEVIQVTKLLADYDRPWAICGGWAIDLFLNRVTRPHKDVDFAILRKDQLIIQEYLLSRGWTLEKAINGQLVPWQKSERIDLPIHTIWCKNPNACPDFVELLFNEVDEGDFRFRRDTSIRRPIEKMIISSASGIPILAPEIVLLYISMNVEMLPYVGDFKNVLPHLSNEARDWLTTALKTLYTDHLWLEDLS
ncbi:MAG TPA: hypothetical protein VJM08_13345 [Anaerolineales bacterium]|nr:hypothetical protein [Anaerolineales bacterium]